MLHLLRRIEISLVLHDTHGQQRASVSAFERVCGAHPKTPHTPPIFTLAFQEHDLTCWSGLLRADGP